MSSSLRWFHPEIKSHAASKCRKGIVVVITGTKVGVILKIGTRLYV
jgi:hypothetical protein